MQFNPRSIDVHLFDCDGVLLNTNALKVQALAKALKAIGGMNEFVDWATAEFKKNFGRTRIEHFNSFNAFQMPEDFDYSEDLQKKAIDIYSREVVSLYKSCHRIEPSARFIAKILADKEIFVVSASDQNELKEVLPSHFANINISNVYGGPSTKIENIDFVLSRCAGKSFVFYGDSVQDAKAAKHHGIGFIGLTKYASDAPGLIRFCADMDFNVFDDLNQVFV